MYNLVSLGFKYVQYFVMAQNGKGHGIHSPFVFDFITLVLNDTGEYYCYELLEVHRAELLKNKNEIEVLDLGAGSRKGTTVQRRISDIARNALKPAKFSRLLFRMANYFKSQTILELGTSLGITTSYLAYADHAAKVLTMEGVPAIADLARNHFGLLGLKNIELLEGNFDDTLQTALGRLNKVDFAYIDGNHRFEPTVRYFKQMFPTLHADSVVVFDDIHWSEEMEQAWEAVKKEDGVTLTIDLFFIGIVFFKPGFKAKQHFTIRF
jgi:predicted O-methyltransferase YrrM